MTRSAVAFELHEIPTHPELSELPSFVVAVEAEARARILAAVELPEDQRARLAECFEAPAKARVAGHQMVPFYCLLAAHGHGPGERARELGAAFMLIQRGVSMIDKVQDGDGDHLRRWAELGPAATLNAGITAMVLGIELLWALEPTLPRPFSPGVRGSVRRHLLRMSAGQHRELIARPARIPLRDRMDIAGQKATEFSLLTELAGVCLGAEDLRPYRAIGHELALIIQIANDLSDLRRPGASDDLRTGTWNIPLTLLLEALPAAAAQQLERQLQRPGCSGKEALDLLEQLGLLSMLEQRVTTSCQRLDAELAHLPCSGPHRRLLSRWAWDFLGHF